MPQINGCCSSAVRLLVLLLTLADDLEHGVTAFGLVPRCPVDPTPRTRLFSSSKAHNKQAALRQKMEAAKRQSAGAANPASPPNESEAEIRRRNDRLRFDELLRKGVVMSDSDDGYLSRQQEEEEIDAARAGKDRLFEGDPAPTDCFEDLVSINSEHTIGSSLKQRLVPWLRKSSAQRDDYLAIVTDPRPQSPELRETIKTLESVLPADIKRRLIVINADSPAENRRWLRKNGYRDDHLDPTVSSASSVPRFDVYADEKMEWMRSYTALGENRWSITLFIIGNGKIRKLARDVDRYTAGRTVLNAVQAMLDETFV